jgi:uncharacterized membrane protein
MSLAPWLEILLVIIGIALILLGGYLYFQQWSNINMRTRAYTYISEAERDKRSLKTGFSAVLFMFGVFLIIGSTSNNVTLFLVLAALSSPLTMLVAIFRMRRDLEPYTKMKDDVVFLDDSKKSKN